MSWPARPDGRGFHAFHLTFFALLFFFICFLPGYKGWIYVHSEGWLPIVVFLIVFACGFLIDPAHRRRLVELRDWPLWLLVAALACGLLAPTHRDVAQRLYLHLALALVTLYYIGKGLAREPGAWKPVVTIVLAMAGVEAGYGILEGVTHFNPLYEYVWESDFYPPALPGRSVGTQQSQPPLGTLMVTALPFVLAVRGRGPWGLAARYGLPALILVCLYLARSRGPFLALIVVWSGYLIARRRKRVLAAVGLVLVAVLAVGDHLPDPWHRFGYREVFRGETGVISPYRLGRVQMAWAMFRDRPLVGHGYTQFFWQFDDYYRGDAERPVYTRVPDNMYLSFLAETGIVGSAAFLVFVSSLLLGGFGVLRRGPPDGRREPVTVLLMAFAGLLVGMGHYEVLYVTGPALLFGLVCGLLAGFSGAGAAGADLGDAPKASAEPVPGRP